MQLRAGLVRTLSQHLPLLQKEGDLIPAPWLHHGEQPGHNEWDEETHLAKNTQFCLFNFNLSHFPNPVSLEATKMSVSARTRWWQRNNLVLVGSLSIPEALEPHITTTTPEESSSVVPCRIQSSFTHPVHQQPPDTPVSP